MLEVRNAGDSHLDFVANLDFVTSPGLAAGVEEKQDGSD
jgi:hypothetical protein